MKTGRRYKNSFRNQLLAYINMMASNVFLREEINNLGEPRQISRALNDLIDDGVIARLGYGVYAKTRMGMYINQPVLLQGFMRACQDALDKMQIEWDVIQAVKDYNEGKTTQIPVVLAVRLKSRYRGKLKYGRSVLKFEGGINAR